MFRFWRLMTFFRDQSIRANENERLIRPLPPPLIFYEGLHI